MNRTVWIALIGLLFLTGIAGNALGKSEESSSSIDPRVDKLIRQLSENQKKLTLFSFQVIDTIDEVQKNGQKIQFSHTRTGTVSQPNKLRIDSVGDISNRSIWKDDNNVTILDRDRKVYGQIESTGSIEEMMDTMLIRYGFTTPLADLLSSDIYTILMSNAQTGQYLGLHNVGKIKYHHLAITQENADWQIWIDQKEKTSLKKMVITYKKSRGEPQYTLIVQSITPLPQDNPRIFRFEPPSGAEKIEFLPIENSYSENDTKTQ